jgi:hypothetical protein
VSIKAAEIMRRYYLLANPLSPGPSSGGTGPRPAMVEQGKWLAQIEPTCRLLLKLEQACWQTVTEDSVSYELQDLMVRHMHEQKILYLQILKFK